ncbi:hypothetical protein C8J55DRAFT_263784 [Lentinula edodes]|uniref:Uncharacterized protein n=1 Tax=Lentinula lateritia TaxID=40482 RepID=A0A9W9DDQ5_9AGAR|nr:hypothetical protein C8J55DRAFT_263784 [Lentinula edodes]
MVPSLFLGLLRLFGFAMSGPVAGSWAAAIQSIFYGARTRGFFSILQRITMSAKSYWPVAVFLGLAAVSVGDIAVWASGAIRDMVDSWYPERVIPDLNLVVKDDEIAEILFDDFLKEVGRRCEEADIPKVQ